LGAACVSPYSGVSCYIASVAPHSDDHRMRTKN
jgi:hypothetical protein